jgi:hypothetical protein
VSEYCLIVGRQLYALKQSCFETPLKEDHGEKTGIKAIGGGGERRKKKNYKFQVM